MQPHNPMLDTYRTLVGDVLERANPLLAKSYLISENEKDSPELRRAKTEWSPVPRLLAEIDAAIVELGESVFSISTDSRLNEQTRADDITAAASATKAAVSAREKEVTTRTGTILDILRVAAYPARPQPADATQEARLAGIKADLRMVWDSISDDGGVSETMTESLRRAIGDEDALSVWLIASTHWPEDYLKSRGLTHYVNAWASDVADILDAMSPPQLADARRVYRLLADGRDGLPLLNTLFAQLGGVVADLAAWRPSSSSPVPWTRAS